MLRMPHIRKHTPQSSRQTRRSVHKRVHVFHANVTHTTTIPANQAQCPQTRPRIPRKRNTPQPSRQTRRGVHKRASLRQNVTHSRRHSAPSAQRSTRNNRSIQAQVNTLPPATVKHSKKSPRGVQRGRGFAAPLRFSSFPQKNTVRHSPKKQTPHSI